MNIFAGVDLISRRFLRLCRAFTLVILTNLLKVRVVMIELEQRSSITLLVNVSKQTTAFPPNFIHSLDATHMMLTALECKVPISSKLAHAGIENCSGQ